MAPPLGSAAPPSLITPEDVRNEVHRLFDAGAGAGLVIKVYGGENGGDDSGAAFREMLDSLQMHSGTQRGDVLEMLVDAPDRAQITRALAVIGQEEHQKQVLNHILMTFGRRLIDPLAEILDTTPTGSIMARLTMLRDQLLARIGDLRMTHESQRIISGDLGKLLTDEYFAMLVENEERELRPRVEKLAQEILRLIGGTFHRAFRRWPHHAEHIANAVSRRCQGKLKLREIPVLIRGQITTGIEEFLWIETGSDIEGALQSMFAAHRDVLPKSDVKLDRASYGEFANACWQLIAAYC